MPQINKVIDKNKAIGFMRTLCHVRRLFMMHTAEAGCKTFLPKFRKCQAIFQAFSRW